MPRPRKPRPKPAISRDSPSENVSLEDRVRYLLQDIGEDANFLEQWIAQYLAELLVRANDETVSSRARAEARTEIATVVPALWEQRIAREALQVRRRIDDWLHLADALDAKTEELLGTLLEDPSRVAEVGKAGAPTALRAVYKFTDLVTRFLFMSASAAFAKRKVASDALLRFLRHDEELRRLRESLARVVPGFAQLDPSDLKAAERLANRTLLALTQAQLALLTGSASQSPVPNRPQNSRERPRPRDRKKPRSRPGR